MAARSAPRRKRPRLDALTDDELLGLRFCDLRLNLHESTLRGELAELHDSLERRDIRFKPHAWLSTEWFSPDGIPGIAIPFYLAHPRLRRLEQRMTGDAEGGSRKWRKRLLRHEAGHALDTAFGLRRMKSWRGVFGKASKPYPQRYSARPGSRRYVLHLEQWYAQSHPTEDFAETFAVWLQPKARWRREYDGWPALRKLEYVDTLMATIAGRRPRNRARSVAAPLSENRRTLRAHYRRRHLDIDRADRRYDHWLDNIYGSPTLHDGAPSAATMLRRAAPRLHRRLIRRRPDYTYLADHAINALLRRLRQRDLRVIGGRRAFEKHSAELLEAMVDDMLRRNSEKYAL